MLKSWSIENFKAIVNSGDLKLAPVTILAGKNSSGKSSLLQSILMIAQTLSNQIPDRPLLPNERIVQLGTFEDILSDYSDSRKLTVKFELSDEHNKLKPEKDIFDLYDSSNHMATVSFASASGPGVSSSAIEASKVTVENIILELGFKHYQPNILGDSSIPGVVDGYKISSTKFNFAVKKMADDELKGFLTHVQSSYLRLVPSPDCYLGQIENYYPKTDKSFLVSLFHFLPTRIIRKFWLLEDNAGLEVANSNPNIALLGLAVEQITQFFSNKLRYLGPLRTNPDVAQKQFAPTSELDEVGYQGEYSAVVYHANKDAIIEWYNPQAKQIEQGTMQTAMDVWVQYLGIAHQVQTAMAGGIGVIWKVIIKKDQKARTLSEVGGGVNHVLPILVMGLLSPENSLLIIEEPEATLHPGAQARLGDFFIGIAKCHKQCIIETHSENIVSQLRYHIVEAGGQENSDCIIYFVDQDEKGAAKFEPVEISPNGNILNWPDGFFDETMHQEDRITAASIRKRAKKAKNG